MKKFFGLLGMAVLGGAITLGGYKAMFDKEIIVSESPYSEQSQIVQTNYNPAFNANKTSVDATSIDFTLAAERTVNSVVHVKNTAVRTQSNPWAELFYGNGNGTRKFEQVGTGSGVIISSDGYIVTNNHVIDNASAIEITLNNQKKYKAELIGADKSNDIALLKIDAEIELPYTPFANSDNIKIGEWVLAVGNPYNLTSTVTAGIVSAKGRSINLLERTGIESFIQTDAAVNKGNSGGALINTNGELIGINTAILSEGGNYEGFSFAIPSNIVRKIIKDLVEFGNVQRGWLGVEIVGVDNDIAALNSIYIYKSSKKTLTITGLENQEGNNVKIYNAVGKQVLNRSIKSQQKIIVQLPISLSTGMYIVKLQTTNGSINKKVFID